MPKLGEVRKDAKCHKLIWHACVNCGKERWVRLLDNKPKNQLCRSCFLAKLKDGSIKLKWKGGRTKNKEGYIKIYAPWHLFADHGYVFEHRLAAEAKLNRLLRPSEVCHHINGIITDNSPENIEVCRNQSEHRRAHKRE